MGDVRTVLLQCFQTTLAPPDNNALKQAERTLVEASKQPNHTVNVLKIVEDRQIDQAVRLAAAVSFKNIIKSSWCPNSESDLEPVNIVADEREAVKKFLVTLMLQSEPALRSQLSEALTMIANADYPVQWSTLMPELVTHLGSDDLSILVGALETISAVCKRFRNTTIEECNDALDYTQKTAGGAVLMVAQKMSGVAANAKQDREMLKLVCNVVRLANEVVYSLNVFGLSITMETFVSGWMEVWTTWLDFHSDILNESDEDQESAEDAVKATICLNCQQFLEMQESDIEPHLATFMRTVWGLLVGCSSKQGQDNLAMAAIGFLTAVSRSVHYKLFAAGDTIKQICEGIIIPNVRFRADDEESFEMNYVEYIRRDLEGSDTETRRRAACDFVKCLVDKIPQETTDVVSSYISALLSEYVSDPQGKWATKDCALYMVMALAVKGKTQSLGATTLNPLVDVAQFYEQHVLPELTTEDVNLRPVLKADALRFVHLFRSKLDKAKLVAVFPALVNLLQADSAVVHSYAAITIQALFALKISGAPLFTVADISAHLDPLLKNVFGAFGKDDSAENEYLMKCVMQLIAFIGPAIIPVAPMCLEWLTNKLLSVCQNPKFAGFNHNLFESVAALINATAGNQEVLTQLENRLFPCFDVVLQQDVQDLHPYVFQIFGLLIVSNEKLRPEYVDVMLQPFLRHEFWERKGNIPALTMLMQAYLQKCGPAIVERNFLQPMLGIFQKVLSLPRHTSQAHALLTSIFFSVPLQALQPYISQIFIFLFQNLTGRTKSTKNTVSFIVTISKLSALHGPMVIMGAMEQAQAGSAMAILGQVVPNNISHVSGPEATRAVAVGMTRAMCEFEPLHANFEVVQKLLAGLVQLLSGAAQPLPAEEQAAAEQAVEAMESIMEYSNEFSKLQHVRIKQPTAAPEVTDLGQYLAVSLSKLAAKYPGRLPACMQGLPEASKGYLATAVQAAGVTIA